MRRALLVLLFTFPAFAQTLTNPNCPGATAASGVMPHCASFNWTANPAGGVPTGYNLYRASTSGGCTTLTASTCTRVNGQTPITATNYTDNSSTTNILTEGTTYTYVVTALEGAAESGPSAPFSGQFPAVPPGAPQTLTGTFK